MLNRHGDQAYKERNIRQAGGATNFEAIITYPDTETQIPSKYKYTIHGNDVVDEYANGNPDKYNEKQDITTSESTKSPDSNKVVSSAAPTIVEPGNTSGDLSSVDTNNNEMEWLENNIVIKMAIN